MNDSKYLTLFDTHTYVHINLKYTLIYPYNVVKLLLKVETCKVNRLCDLDFKMKNFDITLLSTEQKYIVLLMFFFSLKEKY